MKHVKKHLRPIQSGFDDVKAETVNVHFKESIYVGDEGDEETLKALIYPNSPVLSFESASSDTFLHLLCNQRNPNIVIAQCLIDFGINIDKQNTYGDTPLHEMIRQYKHFDKHINMIRLLLKNGANREVRNSSGLTPIQMCLLLRNLDAAEEFLKEEDKLPNARNIAGIERRRHLVKCLVRERNHCNIFSSNYSVLLHFALHEKDEELFEYVMNNSKFNLYAVHAEYMLLNLVIEKGTLKMIASLANASADLDASCSLSKETPLIVAIKNYRTDVANFLLDCGVSVNKTQKIEKEENSPLHHAICKQNLRIVERLLKMGADVNALTYYCSPLILACRDGLWSRKWPWPINRWTLSGGSYNRDPNSYVDVKIVKVLLDHGADIEAKNLSNRTALDQACRSGALDIVELLLNRGAKIDQGDVSTLHHAVRGENLAVIKLILEQGANIDYRCAPEKMLKRPINDVSPPPPRTPLECALWFIRKDFTCRIVVETLVKHGVNLHVADPVRRETPLHIVCRSGIDDELNLDQPNGYANKTETLKFLLWECNANVNAIDSKGLVPLDKALFYCTTYFYDPEFSFDINSDLVTLIAFIAKMLEARECVNEKNRLLLEHKYNRTIYQKCVKEISLMKKNIWKSRKFSFFDILCTDIDNLGMVLRDKNLLKVLNNSKYRKKFPIYAGYLEYRIRQATIRQSFVELTIFLFQKYVCKNISVDQMLDILQFLNVYHLKNFAKACFVDDAEICKLYNKYKKCNDM